MVVAELKLLGSKATNNDANDTKEAVEPWGQVQSEPRKQAPVEPWSREETGLPF